MQTDINKRNANINMILCFVLGLILASILWYFLQKPQPPVIIKGKFNPVSVTTTKPIPGTNQIVDANKKVNGQILSKAELAEIEKFKTLYNLTHQELDSLIVQYNALDSLQNASNDKYYQELYQKCKPVEFTHAFKSDDSTFNATVSGISNGAPTRLKLDWNYKAPPPKKTAFALWGGLEAGTTISLTKFNAKANLDFQIGESTMIKTSFDTDQRIYLGISKSIFDIKR
jgi:hypothetical protein